MFELSKRLGLLLGLARSAALVLAAATAVLATSAAAQRGVVIDRNASSLSNCVPSCSFSLGNLNTFVGTTQVYSNGSVTIQSGANTYNLLATSPGVTYTLFSGYTSNVFGPNTYEAYFINFYAPGSNTTPNSTGNLPDPNFQIQFTRLLAPTNTLNQKSDLEIAFAYRDLYNGDRIPVDATIGYTGPTSQLVTNSNGLLLGTRATDSQFRFIFGNNTFTADIVARYAAAVAVPEPATWAMMLLGFAMIGGRSRQQRRQKLGNAVG